MVNFRECFQIILFLPDQKPLAQQAQIPPRVPLSCHATFPLRHTYVCSHSLISDSSHIAPIFHLAIHYHRHHCSPCIAWVYFINMLTCSFYIRKWCGAKLLFHQQNDAQLYQYAQLVVTPYFYAVRSTPCTSKISINLLEQKPLIECWWNWHLMIVEETGPKRTGKICQTNAWKIFSFVDLKSISTTIFRETIEKASQFLNMWNVILSCKTL